MRSVSRTLALLLVFPALSPGQAKAPAKDPQTQLTGMYRGWYHYPDDSQRPVSFQMVLLQEGEAVVGLIKEPNTFGTRMEPWLQSLVKGKFDPMEGTLTFTKTYDGTAGPDHPVEYKGQQSKDGAAVEGTWAIGEFGGRFTMERMANSRPGPLAGLYQGVYHYPKALEKKPVDFHLILIYRDMRLAGFSREANTFGKRKDEPFLHAEFRGRLDAKTGALDLVKAYDGTAGEDGEVEYTGMPNRERTRIEGDWVIPDVYSGRFTLQRTRLDPRTLENLK